MSEVERDREIYSKTIPNLRTWHDATSLGTADACLRKYEYRILNGWVTREDNIHLLFGLLYHDCLEVYHKLKFLQGLPHEECMMETYKYAVKKVQYDKWMDDTNVKNDFTLLRSVVWYMKHYEHDKYVPMGYKDNKGEEKIAIEQTFAIPFENGKGLVEDHIIGGHMDAVNVDEDGDVFIFERKTTKNTLNAHFADNYNPDNQIYLYSWAGPQLYRERIAGIILDVTQTTVYSTKFRRYEIKLTPEQNEETGRNLNAMLQTLEHAAMENYFPQQMKNCWNCPFKKVCREPEYMREGILHKDFQKRIWDPSEVRG